VNKILFLFLVPFLLYSQEPPEELPREHKSPQEIQKELDDAEAQYKDALEMFNPWYSGPLLTGSSSMMPPGSANVQPYIFVTDNYARFDEHNRSHSIPDLLQVNPQFLIQAGVTNWMDVVLGLQTLTSWQSHQNSGGFGDMSLTIGFPLLRQTPYLPGIKITFAETFPTGKYDHLSSTKLGTDSTGAGVYQTAFGLAISKVVFWSFKHPMNLRATLNYAFSTTAHVKGFNSYGGGFGTHAKVRPGNAFRANIGIEYSFTQRWVFANDFVYSNNCRTTFSGDPGTNADGSPAGLGGQSNYLFSWAPALEYNPTPNLGFVAGVWVSLYGRNALNFVSGIASVTYTFQF
jgi:hypothetical protein